MQPAGMKVLLACLLLSASCVNFDDVVAPPSTEQPAGRNVSCADNGDCAKELVCIANACKQDCKDDNDNADCVDGYICISNNVAASFCAAPVAVDDECAADLFEGFQATDAVCNDASLGCIDGICRSQCNNDSDCMPSRCGPETRRGDAQLRFCE
jgi:hypothetical protein